jgi:hypothetical protein
MIAGLTESNTIDCTRGQLERNACALLFAHQPSATAGNSKPGATEREEDGSRWWGTSLSDSSPSAVVV